MHAAQETKQRVPACPQGPATRSRERLYAKESATEGVASSYASVDASVQFFVLPRTVAAVVSSSLQPLAARLRLIDKKR